MILLQLTDLGFCFKTFRRKTPWKQNFGDYVSGSQTASSRSPNGCTKNGKPVIICKWLDNSRVATSTRIPSLSKISFDMFCQVSTFEQCQWKPLPNHMEQSIMSSDCSSWQERFVKFKKRTCSKQDKTTSDLSVGWYSKEDMSKVLKWNANLVL